MLSIANRGPQPVTIEAVSMLSPQEQADQARDAAPWPLTPAGRPRWLPDNYRLGQAERPIAGLSLAGRQDIVVGIPVRMSGVCHDPGGRFQCGPGGTTARKLPGQPCDGAVFQGRMV